MAEKGEAFESYVALQAQAAAIVRAQTEGRDALLARIEELESELQVWKVGHREAVKDKEVAQREMRDYDSDPIALCLLDGDGCLFNRELVSKGREGGKEAAQLLTKHTVNVANDVVKKAVSIVCHVFYNKQGLSRVFQDLGIATEPVFSAFVHGFNSAHPLFSMLDVGPQKEAADAKFRESLKMFSKLPQCKLILAGCEHDNGYSHLLQSLETEGSSDKLRILKSFDQPAFEISRLNLPTVRFPGLFETKKLVSFANTATPKKPVAANAPTAATFTPVPASAKKLVPAQVHITPSAAKFTIVSTPTTVKAVKTEQKDKASPKLRPVDPKKSLSKQSPPPCNAYYLKGDCFKGAACPYAHDYALSTKMINILRADAKKSPCADALKGKKCGDDCIAGHKCPFGRKCRYGDSCRFRAPGMHPAPKSGAEWTSSSDATTDESTDESD